MTEISIEMLTSAQIQRHEQAHGQQCAEDNDEVQRDAKDGSELNTIYVPLREWEHYLN